MFLLYVGPVVLKDVLPIALYENYMLFHCAITILCSIKHINKIGIDFAHELLVMFIKHSQDVYGLQFLIYNVHMLCHLCDDVRLYGVLDNYSAFPFENYLGSLKRLVKSPKKPLQQIVKRLKEIELSTSFLNYASKEVSVFYPHDFGPKPNVDNVYDCFKKAVYKHFAIYVFDYRKSDCYCFTKNNKVIEIHNILRCDYKKSLFVYCKEFTLYNSYYMYPINSIAIDVFKVSNLSDLKILAMEDIVSKCVVIPEKDYFVSLPIVHTLNYDE